MVAGASVPWKIDANGSIGTGSAAVSLKQQEVNFQLGLQIHEHKELEYPALCALLQIELFAFEIVEWEAGEVARPRGSFLDEGVEALIVVPYHNPLFARQKLFDRISPNLC